MICVQIQWKTNEPSFCILCWILQHTRKTFLHSNNLFFLLALFNWDVSLFNISYFWKWFGQCIGHVSFEPKHLNSYSFREIQWWIGNETEINFHTLFSFSFAFHCNCKCKNKLHKSFPNQMQYGCFGHGPENSVPNKRNHAYTNLWNNTVVQFSVAPSTILFFSVCSLLLGFIEKKKVSTSICEKLFRYCVGILH